MQQTLGHNETGAESQECRIAGSGKCGLEMVDNTSGSGGSACESRCCAACSKHSEAAAAVLWSRWDDVTASATASESAAPCPQSTHQTLA